MFGRPRKALVLVGAVLLIGAAHTVEAQVNESGRELVEVAVQRDAVEFQPTTSESMTLTVAGTGYRYRESFRGGQTPAFIPVDDQGFSLRDGVYLWSLAESPELPAFGIGRGTPANGRASHQSPAPAGRTQSGAFSIVGGRMVDPTLREINEARVVSKPRTATGPTAVAEYHDSDARAASGSE